MRTNNEHLGDGHTILVLYDEFVAVELKAVMPTRDVVQVIQRLPHPSELIAVLVGNVLSTFPIDKQELTAGIRRREIN